MQTEPPFISADLRNLRENEDAVVDIWKTEADSILKPKDGDVINRESRQLGPTRKLTFKNAVGHTINAVESFSYRGHGFELKVAVDGKTVAFINYVTGGGIINIGKVDVEPAFQRCGLNTRMFADICKIHPDISSAWKKLDSDNYTTYRSGLERGLDVVSAARQTPAGKVSEQLGWEIDLEQSSLPSLDVNNGRLYFPDNPTMPDTVRLVYKRNWEKKD